VPAPDRASLPAVQAGAVPAVTSLEVQERRDTQAAPLRRRLRQIDTAENAEARETETLAHLDDPRAPALTALRGRIVARFTELEDERAKINTQLADLDKTQPQAGNPSLLDALPYLGDILAGAPTRLQQHLYQAFDLQALYKKNMHQASLSVTIANITLRALAAILGNTTGNPGSTARATASDPAQPQFSDLPDAPIRTLSGPPPGCGPAARERPQPSAG
jgi:hypothetical protein